MSIAETIKAKPVTATIVGVAALIAILWVASSYVGGGSSGAVIGSSGPSADAQLAAATQLQISQTEAAQRAKELDASTMLASQQQKNDFDLGIAKLVYGDAATQTAATLAAHQIDIEGQLQHEQILAGVTQRADDNRTQLLNTAQIIAGQVDQAQITADQAVDLAQIAANVQINQANVAGSVEKKKSSNGLLGGIVSTIGSVLSFF